MRKLSSMWFKSNSRAGYLLLEIQISLLVITLLVGALSLNFRHIFTSWHNMLVDTQLNTAGRYMQAFLDKEIGYQGQEILIEPVSSTGANRIVVQTSRHSMYYTYYWKKDKKGLYRRTDTTETYGINPLYIPDCLVTAWDAQKVANDALLISFTLTKDGRNRKFTQLILCVNGEVDADVR